MPRGRPTKTAKERLDYCRRHGITVDKQDEWILSAFTWQVTHNRQVRTELPGGTGHRRLYATIAEVIMGEPPEGRQWRRHDASTLNFRRGNFYIAEPYRLGPKARQKRDRAHERRLFAAVRAAIDAASRNGSGQVMQWDGHSQKSNDENAPKNSASL